MKHLSESSVTDGVRLHLFPQETLSLALHIKRNWFFFKSYNYNWYTLKQSVMQLENFIFPTFWLRMCEIII